MSVLKKEQNRKKRRALRVKANLKKGQNPYRVSVSRSNRNISAQLIDDNAGVTLASVSAIALNEKGDKTALAKKAGIELAKKGLEKGIQSARFDRGSFLFHGRVKSFAEGLCEGGLKV